jgi:hypothetical protein
LAFQQSVTQFVAMIAINLITHKAAAKQELLFNKPTSAVYFLNARGRTFYLNYLGVIPFPKKYFL